MRTDELKPGDRVWIRTSNDGPVLEGTVEHGGAYWDGIFSWPASLIRHDDGREDVYLEHMILGRVHGAWSFETTRDRSSAGR